MADGQIGRKGASGKVNSYSDYVQAMNYYINTALNKEPTPRQKEAVDRLNANDVKRAKADASKEVKEKQKKSSQERAERVTRNEPSDITELKMRQDLENPRNVRSAPRPVSAMEAARDAKELPGRAAERRAGSGSSRPSTVDTQSKKPIAKRIMEALGDNRNMEQATRDRKMTEEMEMEREMNVAGRKKGGMAKKKKAPVKKAYGGMVKKKQGGSANKVNMKAGFTRRGCSKG
jgi:hypothetical protein